MASTKIIITGAKQPSGIVRSFIDAVKEMRHAEWTLTTRNDPFPAMPVSCLPGHNNTISSPSKGQMLHAVKAFNAKQAASKATNSEPTFIMDRIVNTVGNALTGVKEKLLTRAAAADKAYAEAWNRKHG